MTMIQRSTVVALARGWIGTPYHHQASCRGVGTDCLGLVRGVWRELYGREPANIPAYSRDWSEARREETLLDAARHHFRLVALDDMRPGDVLIFRLRANTVAKHAAILLTPATMLHAVEGAPVSEVALSSWWRRRIAGVFAFPL
jgi:NlpC/P60 family putative phage cell wall peptidase